MTEERADARRRRWRRALLVLPVLVVIVVASTLVLGLPGPGPLHRYSLRDLNATRDALIAMPDECGRGPVSDAQRDWRASVISIDVLRGRVRIEPGVPLTYWGRDAPPDPDLLAMVDGTFMPVGECFF